MARKIFVSSGHGGTDGGASSGQYIERDLTLEFRNLLTSELQKLGVKWSVDADTNVLKQTLAFIKGKFLPSDILLDIHFNAGGGEGVEVVIPNVSSAFERRLAQSIANVISKLTGFKKRQGGVIPESSTARKTLGWMRPNSENVLIEMCFIDNKSDMLTYQLNKVKIAKEVAKVISDFTKL
jgi:N-acetylmuramoyl-L-alanine amidase